MAIGGKPFWGETTATIDWCENNYEVTKYIAEFWNTVSNLVMILLPMYGLYWSLKQKRSKQLNNFSIPSSTLAVYFALMMIGTGSWLFHMTLLYPMQLLDELPMVYAFGLELYAFYDILVSAYQLDSDSKSKHTDPKLPSRLSVFISIAIYCFLVTYIYINIIPDPIFHQIAFGFLVGLCLGIAYKLLKIYQLSKKLYALIFKYLIFGFVFWNLDNNFCGQLKNYRETVESFFGVKNFKFSEFSFRALVLNSIVVTLKTFSEFHSIWHVCTGISAYLGIMILVEFNYEHHLKSCRIKTSKQRPVKSTCFDLFYDFIRVENETNSKVKNRRFKY